jgi:hypothetical protein
MSQFAITDLDFPPSERRALNRVRQSRFEERAPLKFIGRRRFPAGTHKDLDEEACCC